jgi:hypothetical protein
MRYANLHSRRVIGYGSDLDVPVSAEARRAVVVAKAAVNSAAETARRFARSVAPLVRRDGTFDRSAIMRAAVQSAKARAEVTGDAWGVCMSYALKGAWAVAKASRVGKVH